MQDNMAKSAHSVQKTLNNSGLECTVLELATSTRTATDAASSIGCNLSQIVKSLIFKTKDTCRPVLVLAAGSNKVNEKQITSYVGETIVKADADFTKEVTGFAIGGVPPIGHRNKIDLIFIDQELMSFDNVWAAAGTPNAVFCINSKDLLSLTNGRIIELS